jgi:hypothetical protein
MRDMLLDVVAPKARRKNHADLWLRFLLLCGVLLLVAGVTGAQEPGAEEPGAEEPGAEEPGAQEAGAQEKETDPHADHWARRFLVGLEWVRLIPTGDLWDAANGALVPGFTLGYADLGLRGLNLHAGLGYWYLTGREDPTEGAHAFPVYGEIEYAPLRNPWLELGVSLQGGGVRTEIVKRGGEWTKREKGLEWYGYGAGGLLLTFKPGSFLRIYTGARWTMLIQQNDTADFVGIPLGFRVRL